MEVESHISYDIVIHCDSATGRLAHYEPRRGGLGWPCRDNTNAMAAIAYSVIMPSVSETRFRHTAIGSVRDSSTCWFAAPQMTQIPRLDNRPTLVSKKSVSSLSRDVSKMPTERQ